MKGTRRYIVSLLLVALVVAGLVGTALVRNLKPRLGLDLRGGLSVTLTAPPGTRPDILAKTVEVLRNRVDRAGVAEPEISTEGSSNVLIQLPGVKDRQRLLKLIGRTAQLQFRQVKEEIALGSPNYESTQVSETDDPQVEIVLASNDKSKIQLAPAELTGGAVRDASAVIDPNNGAWRVELRFGRQGSQVWEKFTGRLACEQGTTRRIAIVLDARVESSPQVGETVQCNVGITGGTTEVTGGFSEREAKDLALVLNTGALPVKLEQSEVRTVSPTLGRESLRAGLIAGGLGLALVMLYVLVYYRALGLQTWLGLAIFSSVIYGLVVILGAVIGWSLTLAGIAGLIVSIGIATDSYIVFFERVKEEVHEGKTLRSSMDRGFKQAWRTLRTANAVTIMAAIVLYVLAVGPVRGFALALGMATTLDLAVFFAFTWPLAALLARNRFFSEGKLIGMRRALEGAPEKRGKRSLLRKIYRSEFSIDFIGRRRMWLTISAGLVLVSALALVPAIRGLSFGIDFKGGTLFRAPAPRALTVADVRPALTDAGEAGAVVQIVEDPTTKRRQVLVQTGAKNPDQQGKLVDVLASAASTQASEVDIESVGEKWGRQITTKAVRGLLIFLVIVILYMSWRLEPKMAAAGLVALGHDIAITAGIYAIVGFQVSPATVIAILTILGYSLYDTVVVFDKIRENTQIAANARKSYGQIANESMNQVLMRSINTSLTTLLPVGSLLFVGSVLLGADTLKDLALALFIGIASGTYSSIFVAGQLLSIWKEREPRYASIKSKVLTRALSPDGVQRAAPGPEPEKEEEPPAVFAAPARRTPEVRPSSGGQAVRVQQRRRSRKQRKKKRR